MKFGQLILRNNIKIVATRCQILKLKRTKIDFGCPRPCWGSLQRSPRSLAGLKGPTSRGGRGRGRQERGGKGEGKGKERREGRGGTPVCIFKFSLE